MEFDLPGESSNHTRRTQRRTGTWMEITLISGFLFSLLVGLAAAAALWMSLRSESQSPVTPASETISLERIVPQLALAQLAGDSAEALAYQAVAAQELDTASAIVLATAELPGPQRLSLLLRLGERYLANERTQEAAVHFNLARAIAVSEPSLEGTSRSNALAQIAEGYYAAGDLRELDASRAALDAARQSMRAVEQTPGLLPAHRSEAYERLRPLAAVLNDQAFSQELAELARDPYREPPGILIPSILPAVRTNTNSAGQDDPQLMSTIAQREQAARQLADRIALTQGLDIAPETQTLASALLQEDGVREAYYRRLLEEGLTLDEQYTLHLDRRAWLALKSRVAQLGFGLSLIPQWEQEKNSIRQELAVATANVNLVANAIADEKPNDVEKELTRTESLLWLAQQAELDLYPGASIEELNDRLQVAQQTLLRLGSPLALPVSYDAEATPSGFRMQPTR